MARSRLLANKILTSEKLNGVPEGAENLFYHLLVLVDDFGRYYAKPQIVKSYCYPLRELPLAIIIERLDELDSIGLIQRYKSNGETYLEIVEFEKYQKFRSDIKRKEDFPIPKEYCNEFDTLRDDSDTGCDVKKSTVNRNGNNNKGENESEYPTEFESFWNEYPKKKGKKSAYLAWKEHPKKNHQELIDAARNYYQECLNKKTETEYIKDPSGFIRLKKEYWKDYLTPVEPIKQAGESRLPKKSSEKKAMDDEYVKARIEKHKELWKKHKVEEAKNQAEFEQREYLVDEEMAKWHKKYHAIK